MSSPTTLDVTLSDLKGSNWRALVFQYLKSQEEAVRAHIAIEQLLIAQCENEIG